MARRRRESADMRETRRIINAARFAIRANNGGRVYRPSLNANEVSIIVCSLMQYVRFEGEDQRTKLFDLAKRVGNYKNGTNLAWLRSCFFPPAQTTEAQ